MIDEPTKTRIAVIGLGNELMADDGVGVHAIRRLREILPADVSCVEIGTASLRAQAVCEQAQIVIAVDAVQAGGPPGSVYVFDIADASIPRAESLHSLSLAGLIRLIPPAERPQVVVVGVEPARVECSLTLSEAVEVALPRVIHVVKEIVESEGRIAFAKTTWSEPVKEMAAVEENP